MSRFPLFHRLHRLAAPPVSFIRAFAHAYLSIAFIPPKNSQNTALQDQAAQLQTLWAQLQALPFLQAALDAVPDGVVIYNPAKPLALNPAAQELFGVAGSALFPNLPPQSLCYPSGQTVPPGGLPWVRAADTQAFLSWTPYLIAQKARIPYPVEIAAYPVPGGSVAIVRDISAQNQASAKETQARHVHQTLAKTARHLGRTPDLDSLCQITTDAAVALLPPETRLGAHALLCTFAGQGSSLIVRSTSPPDSPQKKPRRHADTVPPAFEFDAQSPLLWAVYLDRQTVVSADINADPRFDQPRERALLHSPRQPPRPVTSALMLPLLPGAAASGHLLLTSSLPDAFSPELQETLALLASLSAAALARAQSKTLLRRQDDQWDALQQAVAAAALGPAPLNADTLARCAAAALGAAVCVLSRLNTAPLSSLETNTALLHAWGQSPPDAALPPSAHRAAPVRCACARAAQNALRRDGAAWQVGIPNPPLGECAWRAFGGQSGTHSALAVPLRRGDTICGALTLFWHGSRPFSPQEIRLAETFATLAALALPADK